MSRVLRIRDLVGRDQGRAHRTERVERLAARPLAVPELEVARRDIVEAGVAEDVVERVGLADTARRPPDDHGELGLVIDLGGQLRVPADLGAVADDRAGPLAEDERGGRPVRALLVDMLAIVATDGHDLAGPGDGCQEFDLVEWTALVGDPPGVGSGTKRLERSRAGVQETGHGRRSALDQRRRRQPAVARDHTERIAAEAVVAVRDQPHRGRLPGCVGRTRRIGSRDTGASTFSILTCGRRIERYPWRRRRVNRLGR